MKNLIGLVALLVLPAFTFGQSQQDYEHVMNKFVKFYNSKKPDSILHLWPTEAQKWMKRMWTMESIEQYHEEFGKITACAYLGIDTEDPNPGLAVFKTTFSNKEQHAISLTLDEKVYLGTFRFITESDGIDKMMQKK